MYQYKKYQIIISCVLLLMYSSGAYAASTNNLFKRNKSKDEPAASQPITQESTASDPDPTAPDPTVTESIGTEPTVTEPEVTEPTVTEPEVAESLAVEQTNSQFRSQGPLTLREAEGLALENDSLIKKFDAEAVALRDRGEAATRLPDPKLTIGFMNVPADTFDLKEEAMTQEVIGIQQTFPPSSLLEFKGEQMGFMGMAMSYQSVNQKREVLRGVRRAWLGVYLQHHAGNIVRKSQDLFGQLLAITKSQYRSGSGNQQNVVQAQLEESLLKDKEINIEAMKENALAELAKWLDESQMSRSMMLDSLSLPELGSRDALRLSLENHPTLEATMASAQAAKTGIDVAKSGYYHGWTVDLSYSNRQATPQGNPRAEFFSLMFMVDIPLFTSKRQDKWVAASEKEYNSALYTVEERRKDLKRTLDAQYSSWMRLSERLQHYRGSVLPRASQNAEAALSAYRSQVTEFNPLMRARLLELQIKLQALQLLVDRAQSQVDLLYLTGDGL